MIPLCGRALPAAGSFSNLWTEKLPFRCFLTEGENCLFHDNAVLCGHQMLHAVDFPELGLFDFSRGIPGHRGEDNPLGALIPGQLQAEAMNLVFGETAALFTLDDCGGDFAQPLVGHTDDGDILNGRIGAEKVLNLYGVDILTAGDDHVLLPIYQVVEAVGILHGHITGFQPAVGGEHLSRSFRIVVIAGHHAGALDTQLAHIALGDLTGTVLGQNFALPAIAGHTNGADLVDVFHAQMDAARAGGFRQAVVGVVFVIGEVRQPALDQYRGHRLCANVH